MSKTTPQARNVVCAGGSAGARLECALANRGGFAASEAKVKAGRRAAGPWKGGKMSIEPKLFPMSCATLRLYAHMKEVRRRLTRDYKLENIGSLLQRNLTIAALSRENIIEQVLIDNLTEKAAYKLEHDQLREYVLVGKREQLWNVIPGNIYTPQEMQAFIERLQRNTNSRDRWTRYFSGRTLATLTSQQINTPLSEEPSLLVTEGIRRQRGI
jgi:hypothetical protein